MGFLTDDELDELIPAEMLPHTTPIPTQIISSDEYIPAPQSEKQKQVEARLLDMGDELGKKQGLDRREFFQTAAGMAAAFVAMNDTFGTVFDVSRAEAATPAMAQERADAPQTSSSWTCTRISCATTRASRPSCARARRWARLGWNPALIDKPQTIEDLKWNNYFKEIFLDSDTKVALISSAPSDIPQDWFLTNEMAIAARDRVNREAGSKRMYAHAIFTPGQPGWLEALEHALSMKPDSIKGYTIGDNTNKDTQQISLAHGRRAGHLHGLRAVREARHQEHLRAQGTVSRLGREAVPPSARLLRRARRRQGGQGLAAAQFRRSTTRPIAIRRRQRGRRLDRVRADGARLLGQRPRRYPGRSIGVTNVYGDVGQLFAQSVVAEPRLGAALMGILIKGLGADHVCWGTDAIWTGSPQWQIEGLRRLEIPEDMQKKHGFQPLGGATGPVKTAIFSGNNMRLYGIQKRTDLRRPVRRHEGGLPQERRRPQQPALRLRPQAGGLDGLTACCERWRRAASEASTREHSQSVSTSPHLEGLA